MGSTASGTARDILVESARARERPCRKTDTSERTREEEKSAAGEKEHGTAAATSRFEAKISPLLLYTPIGHEIAGLASTGFRVKILRVISFFFFFKGFLKIVGIVGIR